MDRTVLALTVDPPLDLYAASLNVSHSADGGIAWQHVARPASGVLITALAAGSGHPAVLYAGARGAAFVSHDTGATWSPLPSMELAGQDVDDLTYDPATGILYAATRQGLLAYPAGVP